MSPGRHEASHIGIFEIAWQRPGAQPDASSRRKRFRLAFDFGGIAGHRIPLCAGGGQLPLDTSHRRRAKLLGRGNVAARRFRASTRRTRPARTCWNAGEPVACACPRCVAFRCEDDITSWPSSLVHRWRFQMFRWMLHDVCGAVNFLAAPLFRTHVRSGTQQYAGLSCGAGVFFQRFRKSKVQHLGRAFESDLHIGGLQVAMKVFRLTSYP